MKTLLDETISVTNENINSCIKKLEDILKPLSGKDHLEMKKGLLTLEEELLCFQQSFGTDSSCNIRCTRHYGYLKIVISDTGENLKKLSNPSDDSLNLLRFLGMGTKQTYYHKYNKVSFRVSLEKHNSTIINMLIAIALAIITGIIILNLSGDVSDYLGENLIIPIFTKMIAILSAIATPMIFLAVVLGIVGLEYITTIGKIGGRMIRRMLTTYVFGTTLAALVCLLIFHFNVGASGSGEGLGDFVQLILDIIPGNLLEPFTTDNHLQVITLAIFVGIVLLLLGEASKSISLALQQVATVVNRMMCVICKFLPLLIYMGILEIFVNKKLSQISGLWIPILLFFGLCTIVILFVILRASYITKLPVRTLIHKQKEPLLINLTTSSQVAAFPYSTMCCKSHYGIDEKLVDFALPIEMVAYMPCGAVMFTIICMTLMSVLGLPISVGWIIKCIIISIIVAISAPPIPGSGFVVISIVMTGLGISGEGLPLAIIIITICGYFLPLFNGFLMELELLMIAYKEKKVDKKILISDTEL